MNTTASLARAAVSLSPASLAAAPFQFHSRLFGQIKPCLKIPRRGRNLVLLGDCFPMYGRYINDSLQLRDYVSYGWDHVFVVPGLVELTGNGLRSWMRNMEDFQEIIEGSPCRNIMVINNTEVVLPEATLIGSTYWPGMDCTPDQIINRYPQFVKKDVNAWIEDDIEWIDTSIKAAIGTSKQTIFCTYFPVHTHMFSLPVPAIAAAKNLKFIKGHFEQQ